MDGFGYWGEGSTREAKPPPKPAIISDFYSLLYRNTPVQHIYQAGGFLNCQGIRARKSDFHKKGPCCLLRRNNFLELNIYLLIWIFLSISIYTLNPLKSGRFSRTCNLFLAVVWKNKRLPQKIHCHNLATELPDNRRLHARRDLTAKRNCHAGGLQNG